MPTNTNVQNVQSILDAVADYGDVTLDNAIRIRLIERFNYTEGDGLTNEANAGLFLDWLQRNLRDTIRSHKFLMEQEADLAANQLSADSAAAEI